MLKIRLCRLLILATFMLSISYAFCQSDGEWRVRHVVPQTMSFKADTLSIRAETFVIHDVPSFAYRLDPIAAMVYLQDSALLGKTLVYRYQTYTLDFAKPYAHKSRALIESPGYRYQPAVGQLRTMADLQQDNQLLSNGSISRGVSVGNRQDLVLNSTLNLQLSGQLSEDVRVEASISDKNIPIQPEGNTQYLHDINNIFITIYIKHYLEISAGDVLAQKPSSRFLFLSRNLLGMKAKGLFSKDSVFRMTSQLGGGVTKGSYARQSIVPQNGVQGPYRLYGKANEINITVVAGSERVYVDGVLLTRGQDHDYVMDYNTAEITFTPSMLVTSEKRIVVEFEYTDRHYTRYSLFSYNSMVLGKRQRWTLDVHYFREQDLKNHPVQPELTDAEKMFLSRLEGDTPYAYYARCDSAAFSPEQILYARRDTLVAGQYYSVYVYSASEDEQLYRLSFTYLGPNKGSYRLLRSTTNGRVFGWVAPVDGVLQGDYEPVVQLATPMLTQMLTVSGQYAFRPQSSARVELALSHKDVNTFSKQDNRDNVGFAIDMGVHHRQMLRNSQEKKRLWSLVADLDWQFVHKNFRAVERFREVEFARQYNLAEDQSFTHSEQMLHAEFALAHPTFSTTHYRVNWFNRIGDMNALRQELVSDNHLNHWVLRTNTSFLSTRDSVQQTAFWSSQNQIAYRFSKLEFGVRNLLENNMFRTTAAGSLRPSSYAFYETMAYLKSDSAAVQYQFSYKNREEMLPVENRLRLHTDIHEAGASLRVDRLKNQHVLFKATYRNQRLRDSLDRHASEHYFVGNIEYTGRFCKNAIVLNTYYEAGSGMELRKTFTFLKVAMGQGTHIWIDYNGDGLEDIGEFEVAAFQDEANYVKVWLAGTEYVNTYNNQFTQTVQLRPAAVWQQAGGFRRFLARFSDVAMLRSQLKHQRPNFNPFYSNLMDTALMGRQFTVTNTFSFNNSASKFAFDFIVQKSMNKNLLYYGYEQNGISSQQVVLKSAPSAEWYLQAGYQHMVTDNRSDYLTQRTYEIVRHQADGKVRCQYNNRYFGELDYQFAEQRNRLGIEHTRSHEAGGTFTFRSPKYGAAVATVRYVLICGEAGTGNGVSYALLRGLAVGHNALWGVTYQVPVSDFLQVSLQYDGRASEGHRVVHTGSVTVKAQF
jgi:hypothetical protein